MNWILSTIVPGRPRLAAAITVADPNKRWAKTWKQTINIFSSFSLSFYLYTYLYLNIIPQLLFLTFQHSLILNSKKPITKNQKPEINFSNHTYPIYCIYFLLKKYIHIDYPFYISFFSLLDLLDVRVCFFLLHFHHPFSYRSECFIFFLLLRISGWAIFFSLIESPFFLADCLFIYKGHIFVSSNVNTSIRNRIMGRVYTYLNKIDREMMIEPADWIANQKSNCFSSFSFNKPTKWMGISVGLTWYIRSAHASEVADWIGSIARYRNHKGPNQELHWRSIIGTGTEKLLPAKGSAGAAVTRSPVRRRSHP